MTPVPGPAFIPRSTERQPRGCAGSGACSWGPPGSEQALSVLALRMTSVPDQRPEPDGPIPYVLRILTHLSNKKNTAPGDLGLGK